VVDGPPGGWRGIDALAAAVGHYGWLEWRLFEVTGAWGTRRGGAPEVVMWCAAAARRHGDLATRWADRLPVRAGVDAGDLVRPHSTELADALGRLADLADLAVGTAVLVAAVLPGLARVYGADLTTVSPVREAPVAEILLLARRTALGETRSGASVVRNFGDGIELASRAGDLVTVFEQVFDQMCVFPAVRTS
jgi:hypothetical protein